MPYAIPSPSTSPTRTSISPSRSQVPRPLRHHMRSQSSDGLVSSSFIYVHPASPEGPSSWEPIASTSRDGPSIDTIPRKARRTKVFGFTPASEEGPSSQDVSPEEGGNALELSHGVESPLTPTPSKTLSFGGQPSHDGPPLVPVHLRPAHAKSASTPAFGKTIKSAFPGSRQTAMVRKKSGELVRSSLKTDFGRDRDHKPRSEPATPTCPKYVHFDTQLEHVKHFLSQQRPAAVSRSGSPVETETEDEPEAFPFPAMTSAQAGVVRIRLPNFPTRLNHDLDTYLESLEIATDGKSLRGVVRVRNLSFEKWVAVRFTLDNWQTVSEVSGEHLESMGPMSDRFVFSIKLQDLLARIEEKTMFIAIRYTVGGREIWDNNDGANYRVEFEKRAEQAPAAPSPLRPITNPSTKRQTWSVTNAGQAADRMADLRRELDRLTKDDLDPSPLHASTRSFTEGSPFSTRYDFGNSLKMFGGGRPSISSPTMAPGGELPPASPTKPMSPYTSSNLVGGMPTTVYHEPGSGSSPVLTRANLVPDFGASSSSSSNNNSTRPITSPNLHPYPLYQSHSSVGTHHRSPESPTTDGSSNQKPGSYPLYSSHSSYIPLSQDASSQYGRGGHYHSLSHPGLQGSNSLSYSPLLPPGFRDRHDSPFGSPAQSPAMSPITSPALSPNNMSPANMSPTNMSPHSSPPQSHSPPLYPTVSPEEPWSPSSSTESASSTASTASTSSSRGTSTYSPESEATSVPESPAMGFPSRHSGPSEFSSFLDRYYLAQSLGNMSNVNGSASPSSDSYSSTPRRLSSTGAVTNGCGNQAYFASPNSSGSSTPSRDEPGTTPLAIEGGFNSFVNGVSPAAIVG